MSDSGKSVEAAGRQIEAISQTLGRLSEHSLTAEAFSIGWLEFLHQALQMKCGRVWSRSDSSWRVIAARGDTQARDEFIATAKDLQVLEQVAQSRKPVVFREAVEQLQAVVVSTIWYPLYAAGELRGVAEMHVPTASRIGFAAMWPLLSSAAQYAERFHLMNDRREAIATAARRNKFALAVHASLDVKHVARVIADEGRLFIGCDRLTVLVGDKNQQRVVAVSGQEVFDTRSQTVKDLGFLARRAAVLGEKLESSGNLARFDEVTVQRLEQYIDENDVRGIVIVPLREKTDGNTQADFQPGRVIGTLIAENFREPFASEGRSELLDFVSECGAVSLRNAQELESIFAGNLLRRLGAARRRCQIEGKLPRMAITLCLLLLGLGLPFAIQTDDTAFCRGTIKAAQSRNLFAASDGIVREVFVAHGSRVKKGEPLAELTNHDLDNAEADLAGRQAAMTERRLAIERALLDADSGISAADRARLAGEQNELRQEAASLKRQAVLYAERRRLLTIRSPIDGEVTTWNAEQLLANRPVRQGQLLLTVTTADSGWEIELDVPDGRSGRVIEAANKAESPLNVSFSPALNPSEILNGSLIEIHNTTEIHPLDGNTVLVRAVVSGNTATELRPGAEVAAHIHLGRRSLAAVWLQDVTDFFRRNVAFRWL